MKTQTKKTSPSPPSRWAFAGKLLLYSLVGLFVLIGVFYVGRATSGAAEGNHGRQNDDPRGPEVEQFVRRYFRSWSEQEMDDYGDCFAAGAVVQHVDSRGRISSSARDDFLDGQRDYHRRARYRAVEVPLEIEIRFEANLARAVVYWKLTAGPRTEFGYDHFTLIKNRDEWQIVNLVFYAVDPSN